MISLEIQEKIEQYVKSCGCELYGVELLRENNQEILRVSIYSPQGVSLDQCQEVSQLLSPFLDVEDPISSEYVLEVSSPGVERVLKNPRHFLLSLGEEIEVKMMDKSKIQGKLLSSDEDSFVICGANGEQKIAYSQTKKVKTIFQW
ncbi:ribosome maturation factor RimP [Helicobacter pametensis]|uniref:ribosome maturation factor RimP n=1 Tax=Helicobacter pametensis TaxID=95149 RepID=UPI0004BC381B|nr:ribosome maturation factor RimP [Helicobacter pametensis]